MAAKYTAQQWKEALPAMRSLAIRTVDIAHAVLVEGRRQADVATANDATRQAVQQAIKRVEAVLNRHDAVGCEPLLLWLPAPLVERLKGVDRAQIEKALSELGA